MNEWKNNKWTCKVWGWINIRMNELMNEKVINEPAKCQGE